MTSSNRNNGPVLVDEPDSQVVIGSDGPYDQLYLSLAKDIATAEVPRVPGFALSSIPVEGGLDFGESDWVGMEPGANVANRLRPIRARFKPLAFLFGAWPGFLPLPLWAESAFNQPGCDFSIAFPASPSIEHAQISTGLVTTTAVYSRNELRLSASCTATYPDSWLADLSDADLKRFILQIASEARIEVFSAERVGNAPFRVFRVDGHVGPGEDESAIVSFWAYGPRSRMIVEAYGPRTRVMGPVALRFFETLTVRKR